MSLSVVWRPEAEVDLLTARDWYEWQSSGLGDEFADVVDTMLGRIETMPEVYAIALEGVPRKTQTIPLPHLLSSTPKSDRSIGSFLLQS